MKVKLGDVAIFLSRGITPKYTDDELFCVLNQKCIRNWTVSFDDARFTDTSAKKVPDEKVLQENDILVCSTGQGTLGRVGQFFGNDKPTTVDSHVTIVRADTTKVDPVFLGYILKSNEKQIEDMAEGSTGQTELSRHKLAALELDLPNLQTQKKIAEILTALDAKIHLNRETNRTLESLATALFQKTFLNNPEKETWKEKPLGDIFNITIGRTPPRKEHQWFSKDEKGNMPWVSIADMGKYSVFTGKTSEYLTPEAVERFNVPVAKEDTIILSFKLTVGRLAITNEKVVTNEAIAHFNNCPENMREYLYLFLKGFNYNKLSSTSSIATAVNSQTVKAIKMKVPDEKTLSDFHEQTVCLFWQIRTNNNESQTLTHLRQTLLPKLISGEIKT